MTTQNPYYSNTNRSNHQAISAIKSDGSVISWGYSFDGGSNNNSQYNSVRVGEYLNDGVVEIFESERGFAALKSDGSVVTWGGGSSEQWEENKQYLYREFAEEAGIDFIPFVSVSTTHNAFAGLREDGTVFTWGDANRGGDSQGVDLVNVSKVFSTASAFAALKEDGSVITWGNSNWGGSNNGGGSLIPVENEYFSPIVDITSNSVAFSALKEDGTIVTWGDEYGGRGRVYRPWAHKNPVQMSDIRDELTWENNDDFSPFIGISSTMNAFAALREDGSVVSWGHFGQGGDNAEGTADYDFPGVWGVGESVPTEQGALDSGVVKLISTGFAFAALKDDGSLVTWGKTSGGGDSSSVASLLSEGVVDVYSNYGSFAALKEDGSLVSWPAELSEELSAKIQQGTIKEVLGNNNGFAALLENGDVISWPESIFQKSSISEDQSATLTEDDISILNQELSNVTKITSSGTSFAALRSDGTVVTWGNDITGGNPDYSYRNWLQASINNANDLSTVSGEDDEITDFSKFDYVESQFQILAREAAEAERIAAQEERYDAADSSIEISKNSEGLKFDFALLNDQGEEINELALTKELSDQNVTLQFSAKTLIDYFQLESFDISLGFNEGSDIFNEIEIDDIKLSSNYLVSNAAFVNEDDNSIRIAASSLSDLNIGDPVKKDSKDIFSLDLEFDEQKLQNIINSSEAGFVQNVFKDFSIEVNNHETILSHDFLGNDNKFNRYIASLNDFGGEKFLIEGSELLTYEGVANLNETGDGLIISTDRVIGADAAETNLVRAGDTLTASTSWINTGNIDLSISGVTGLTSDANAVLESYELSQSTLSGGTYGEDGFISSTEELTLTADITITGVAGSVVDLSKSILEVSATGIEESFSNSKGTKNLITYQGDLNYDGRVSMKDLAYLNAGAARVNSGGDVASDVDANFDAKINIEDLAVLDKDWGKSLHNGSDEFLGSNELSWEELDNQGSKEWDNAVFKEQNAFEAYDGFVGSLESPTSNVIGADGNTTANDDDMLGSNFQEV